MRKCDVPPKGWCCSRECGHTGPCVARPIEDTEKELQPIVPYRGKWECGEEHESKITLSCGLIDIKVTGLLSHELEKWLVEAFHMWPHPNAIVSKHEHDYPNYRNYSYKKLMEK